jgi:hypothetical protein
MIPESSFLYSEDPAITPCSEPHKSGPRPGREADHSPPSGAEVKEFVELCFRSPNTPSWRGAC